MPSTSRRLLAIAILPVLVVLLLAAGCDGRDPGGDGPDGRSEVHAPDGTAVRAGRPPGPPLARGGDDQLSPLDVDDPQLANLDPDLLEAVQEAFRDASADGVELWVTSGWRSREEQQRLLDEAVGEYGSLEEALKFVSTPDKSAHVTGDAVDIGPAEADNWLAEHGDRYGLCQAFANEIWHFELSVTPGGSCPEPLPDGTYR